MRQIIFMVATILLTTSTTQAALVASTSQRDTLSIPFLVLDSVGNSVNLAAGDSVYLTVFAPGGGVVYKDSMAHDDPVIVSATWEDYDGAAMYALVHQVQTLTGGTASRGIFSYVIAVDDNTFAELTTTTCGSFQTLNSTLESSLDSAATALLTAAVALDSLEAHSGRLTEILDSINSLLNSPASAEITVEDKQQIAGYVDDTLAAKHGVGSWAASAIGTGAYSTTIVAYDSVLQQSIGGVAMSVYNLSQTSLKAVVSSDINGQGRINLDADTHIVVATAPGFLFPPFDTVVIAGSQSDTVFGIHFHPGYAEVPELCRVWGYVFDIHGNPVIGGQVAAYLPSGVARISSIILNPTGIATTTDSSGYFFLDLFPSALLTPAGTPYEISISLDNGAILRRRLTVPQESTWQLTW